MEATDLEIHIESVGLFRFELIVPGKAVHICSRNQAIFPQRYGVECGHEVGVDALEKALPFIHLFYRLEKQWNQRWRDPILGAGGHPHSDKQGIGIFALNPSQIEGGTFLASLPGHVRLVYSVLYPGSVPVESIWNELRDAINALASTDDWLRQNPPTFNVPVFLEWKGFETSEDEPGVTVLKNSIKDAIGREAIVSGCKCLCDATYLNERGIPSVVLGPGRFAYGAHGNNEFIPVKDVIEAAKIYASFIIDWCE